MYISICIWISKSVQQGGIGFGVGRTLLLSGGTGDGQTGDVVTSKASSVVMEICVRISGKEISRVGLSFSFAPLSSGTWDGFAGVIETSESYGYRERNSKGISMIFEPNKLVLDVM